METSKQRSGRSLAGVAFTALVCGLVAVAGPGVGRAFAAESGSATSETALDRYVAKPDDAFRFARVSVLDGAG
ncbi:MAG TPA: hypothetical protein VHR17_11220, partial [Thermoanaerobaculia bacterium]|nr:hypothetical protein [Thermoanaerobaculia bacterium]